MVTLEDSSPIVYVLDPSVLLSDPGALFRFHEHKVVLPFVVITALEGKRDDPELGYFARQALRALEELRLKHGSLSESVPVGTRGGRLLIELNHTDGARLPKELQRRYNAQRNGSHPDINLAVLAVACNLQAEADAEAEAEGKAEGKIVTVVSKDLPMRLLASIANLKTEEYLADQADPAVSDGWSGIMRTKVSSAVLGRVHARACRIKASRMVPLNTGIIFEVQSGEHGEQVEEVLTRLRPDGQLREVSTTQGIWKDDVSGKTVSGMNIEQRLAIELLRDEKVGIVSLGGPAGTGKSLLALLAGLRAVKNEGCPIKEVTVLRPIYPVAGQELGYLPGSAEEKMAPWAQAVFDTLEDVLSAAELKWAKTVIKVMPLTNLRGRTLKNRFVILDEAQGLERGVLLTVLTRIGKGSRIIVTHDVAQRDNLRVGRFDGIAVVIELLRGHRLFGHVTLTKSERSEIAAVAAVLLDVGPGRVHQPYLASLDGVSGGLESLFEFS